ncbi:hypothetical protein CBR_g6302 [Chara braunii]|uniref:Uncharacterized protein n=1 Tax=Chara braunii TaxID=69332 RepID=A0A388KJD9_CHABU|nr:hypothetical protein CBR_g6302 [Chara braunii]|eukprot:GBG70171.1 hypothetical protein CBR_g6302 [Chara braunii]
MEGLVLAGEFVERVRDLGKVANERAVIVGKAEEGTELEEGLGWGLLDEGCDLRGVHTDAFSGDNVAEVFDARSGKRTLAELGVEFLLSEDREDLAEVLKVIVDGFGRRVEEHEAMEEVGGGVLLEAAVEEGVLCAVEEGGAAVVTTVMEGLFPSSVVTRSDMDDMVAFMSLREAVTEVWRVWSVSRMAERSGVVVFAGGCSPARFRAMLSTESVRMSNMLMEDAAMSGEEGVEDVA